MACPDVQGNATGWSLSLTTAWVQILAKLREKVDSDLWLVVISPGCPGFLPHLEQASYDIAAI